MEGRLHPLGDCQSWILQILRMKVKIRHPSSIYELIRYGKRVLNGQSLVLHPTSHGIWKHTICARLSANLNYARNHFPHNCGSSYEHPIHCQCEDSMTY